MVVAKVKKNKRVYIEEFEDLSLNDVILLLKRYNGFYEQVEYVEDLGSGEKVILGEKIVLFQRARKCQWIRKSMTGKTWKK